MISPGSARPRIQVLPEETIAQIAAGEVVERPASVVKELVENSLDAGASRICIETWQGGHEAIRVSDDGCGLTRDEIHLALIRHATSKIITPEDLTGVASLGFRGEALPSIAAVCELEITSSVHGSESGHRLLLREGRALVDEPAAAAPGTTVTVRELFHNLPVRRRFLRSPATEAAHITEWVQRLALARPSVGVRLIHDGREAILTPGGGQPLNTALSLFGREVARDLMDIPELRSPGGELTVTGLAGKPTLTRAGRALNHLYVNGRAIRSPILYRAIDDAYEGKLPRGRKPVVLIFLEMAPGEVDVNVHPAKTEVRFADDGLVSLTVRQALESALMLLQPVQSVLEPAGGPPISPPSAAPHPPQIPISSFAAATLVQPGAAPSARRHDPGIDSGPGRQVKTPERLEPAAAKNAPAAAGGGLPWMRALGQVEKLFILAEGGGQFFIVDQHVAHERVLFEQMLAPGSALAQPELLLIPIVLQVDHARLLALQEHQDELARCGFQFEEWAGGAVRLRAVPRGAGRLDPQMLFEDLIDSLHQESAGGRLRLNRERLAAAAAGRSCKRAVKAGQKLSVQEMQQVLDRLRLASHPWTCPHGRPVFIERSAAEVQALFGGVSCGE